MRQACKTFLLGNTESEIERNLSSNKQDATVGDGSLGVGDKARW